MRFFSIAVIAAITLSSSAAPMHASAEDAPFTVGVSLPLTGALAEFGNAIKNGFLLARERDPGAFTGIRFIFEDDRYETKTSVAIFNRFSALEKVNLCFVWGNDAALAVAPLAEKRKMPTVVVAQDPRAAIGYRYVIRFINPARDYSAAILGYFRRHGFKKIGMLKAEISFFNVLVEELRAQLNSDESLTVIDSLVPGESDLRPTVAKVKQAKFDILGVYLMPAQVIQFYRHSATQNLALRTFGTTAFDSSSVVAQTLGHMTGAVYAHLAVQAWFHEAYLKRFGNDSEISYAANGYDFAVLAAKLFGSSGAKPAADTILDVFAAAPPGTGATGGYRFRESDLTGKYFEFPVVVKRIGENKAHRAEEQ